MIFSKKEKQVVAYSVEQCPQCKKESKRKFKEGDVLFEEGATCCSSCNVQMKVSKIFGETIE